MRGLSEGCGSSVTSLSPGVVLPLGTRLGLRPEVRPELGLAVGGAGQGSRVEEQTCQLG